jgi:hypothetical protein
MDKKKRLEIYLKEAYLHLERIIYAKNKLNPPIEIDDLEDEEIKDKLDVIVFRFSKLQDLLGSKIFRNYLEMLGFITKNKNFLELLKELDKEGIINIDKWAEFRDIRNIIAHEYPYDSNEKIEAINFILNNLTYLNEVLDKIRKNCEINL